MAAPAPTADKSSLDESAPSDAFMLPHAAAVNSRPRRVLLVGYMYGRGGIQSHTHWLATGLMEKGYDVEVVTPDPIHGHSRELPLTARYSVWSYPRGIPLKTAAAAWKFATRGQFDVAIVCGTGWLAMAGVLLNRRIRKRVFFEVMSGEANGRIDPRRLVHAGFDAVVGQAPAVEQKFCEEFGWQGVRQTIPAMPDPLERVANIKPPVRDLSTGIRAAYFGRLAEHKGVGFLVDNWDKLSESIATLDIYGTGPQEADLAVKIDRAAIGDRVRMHGSYPAGAEYVKLLERHDLVLLPTTGKEGAPLVLLEAMACGVPFVANGVGGIPAYANPDCSVTSGNVAEFIPQAAWFCRRLRAGDVDLQRLQKFYGDNFSHAALTRRWDEFISSLLA